MTELTILKHGRDRRKPPGPSVYLAGPMVFYRDPDGIFQQMKSICAAYGLVGFSPIDNQAGLEGHAPGPDLLKSIVRADIALMQRVDAGIFCLDGFRRGPEMDPGTAFEIGYMAALGKPLAGWTADPRYYPARVEQFFEKTFGLPLTLSAPNAAGGTSGLSRDPDGVLVHSDGLFQNAMTHIGIELSGGIVTAAPAWDAAFDAAIAHLARRLTEQTAPVAPRRRAVRA